MRKDSLHSALRCLVEVAAHHGVTTSLEALTHEHAIGVAEPSTAELVRIARSLGLEARAAKRSWGQVTKLKRVFPLLTRLGNGNTVILVGIRPTDTSVDAVVVDPLSSQPQAQLLVPEAAFVESWTGEIIFIKRAYALTDENRPFGLAWFLPEILKQRTAFLDVALAALLLLGLGLLVPVFFQLVIDKVLVHYSQSTLYVLTVGIAIAIGFESVFGFLRQYLLLSATNRIDIRLTTRTFSHLLALPIDYFEKTSAGVTVQHMQQTEKIRQFLTGRLFLTLLDALGLLVFLPILFFYSTPLAALVLLFAGLMALVIFLLMPVFQRRLKDLYQAEAERKAMLVECIQGARTIKASAIEPVQRRKWNQAAADVVTRHFRVGQISISAQAVIHFMQQIMTVAVIATGAQLVFDQAMTVGALVAFQMLAGRVIAPLVQMVALVHEYQETALSVDMLGKVMGHPPERDFGKAGLVPKIRGSIQFDQTSFRYSSEGPPVLDRVTLGIPAGAVVGIVGRSGSGKTTLTRLIQGFHSAQSGVVRIDGIDIREIDLAHLRKQIGVVLQENFLFRASVRDNIAMTKPDAKLDEVFEAARLSGAAEFIENLPRRYDTLLEENAANLSGGQRQRLAIARALLPGPRVLIFDEATSALDPESEEIVMNRLAEIASERTVILVSHRLSMLVGCDGIAVMDSGRIVDGGRHEDLLSRCRIYQELWRAQNRHQRSKQEESADA